LFYGGIKVICVDKTDNRHRKTSTDGWKVLFDPKMVSDRMSDAAEYLGLFVEFDFAIAAVCRAEE